MKQKYYYLLRDKNTGKIFDFKVYNVDKTQKEMDKICLDFNTSKTSVSVHEQVRSSDLLDIMDIADKWRSTASLRDVILRLDDISSEIADCRESIDEYVLDESNKYSEDNK